MSPQSFSAAVLQGLGIPQSAGAMTAMIAWIRAEGGHTNGARYNYLNTTMPMPGAGNTGNQGNIKVYKNWQQGIDATVRTLRNARYSGIRQALHSGNTNSVATAIGASPWGTDAGLIKRVMGSVPTQHGPNPIAPGLGPQSAAMKLPGFQTVHNTADKTDFQSAAIDALMADSAHPGGSLLRDISHRLDSGAYTTPGSTHVTTGPSAGTIGGTIGDSGLPADHAGYVNPFIGSLVAPGRIDEGVDPTIKGAIRAIGNATVVNISHNFYKGQPYLVYRLNDGPHAGKYVYVSELITPSVRVGQHVRAGDVVAQGHGAIETGWAGGPQGSYMPSANRAQGGSYQEGQVTPHGIDFAHFLRTLGAHAAH